MNDNLRENAERGVFSGKLGYVLATAGSAVGLGNIWRFPYLAARYGGGIFLLVYLILALTFGYTLMMSESTLGRLTEKSPVGAFKYFGKGKVSAFGGWINAVIPMLILPYYRTCWRRSAREAAPRCSDTRISETSFSSPPYLVKKPMYLELSM